LKNKERRTHKKYDTLMASTTQFRGKRHILRAAQSYTVHAAPVALYGNLWESMLCYDFDQHLWENVC
jgi:hypothetical protein